MGEGAAAVVLAATDPAQVYGGALPWPESAGRPARAAGSLVMVVDGEAAAYLDRGGRGLLTFPAAAEDDRWIDALAAIVKDGRARSLELQKSTGNPLFPPRSHRGCGRSASSTATEVSSCGRDPPRRRSDLLS